MPQVDWKKYAHNRMDFLKALGGAAALAAMLAIPAYLSKAFADFLPYMFVIVIAVGALSLILWPDADDMKEGGDAQEEA